MGNDATLTSMLEFCGSRLLGAIERSDDGVDHMAITVKCSCGRSILIRAVSATGRAVCPVCGSSLLVNPPGPKPHDAAPRTGRKIDPPALPRSPVVTPPPLPVGAGRTTTNTNTANARGKPSTDPWGRIPLRVFFGVLGLALIGFLAVWIAVASRVSGPLRDVPAPPEEAVAKANRPREEDRSADHEAARLPEQARKTTTPGAMVPESRGLTTREVVEKTGASVALVKGNHGSGSGFLAGTGLVVTNAHVIQNETLQSLEIYFPSAKDGARGPYRASLGYENSRRDLAILKVPASLPSLSVSSDYHFKGGEEITIIGNPGVKFIGTVIPNAVSRGVFSAEITWKGLRYYQLGASVNHGNSGGPVLDSTGKVIGIVTLKAQEEAIGFCIPAEDLVTALANLRVASPEEIRAAGRKHDAAAVFCLLRETAGIYCRALEAHVSRMDTSVLQGRSPNEGLQEVALLISRALRQRELESIGDLGTQLSELVRDQDLPAETRTSLRELWTTYADMKSYVENPRGTYQSFRARTIELKDRFNHVVKDLELSFGIESDD
jgi:S1-C subfamily serine protease